MEDNIFEAAGKQAGSQKKKTLDKPAKELVKKTEGNLSNPEIQDMLQKMQNMKKDLDDQLAAIYQKGKEAKINVSLLVESAANLTAKQREKMEEQQKILSEKILSAIPQESCLRKNPKTKEKLTQERQGKMRGARQKWIPVR